MYYGFELSETIRNKILNEFPAKFDDVICHHVTLQMGNNTSSFEEGEKYFLRVISELVTDKIQCAVVSINDETDRPSGGYYHVTISIDRANGAKPVQSNNVISAWKNDKASAKEKNPTLPISGWVEFKKFE
jgi:hypothetical protein